MPFGDKFDENLPVFGHGLVTLEVVQGAHNGRPGTGELFDPFLHLPGLLQQQLLQGVGVVFLQKRLDPAQGHAVDLHVLDHVQPGGLGDVVIAVAGPLIGILGLQQTHPVIEAQGLFRDVVQLRHLADGQFLQVHKLYTYYNVILKNRTPEAERRLLPRGRFGFISAVQSRRRGLPFPPRSCCGDWPP